jgi:hypothetical protein
MSALQSSAVVGLVAVPSMVTTRPASAMTWITAPGAPSAVASLLSRLSQMISRHLAPALHPRSQATG